MRPRMPRILVIIAAATLLLPEEASFFIGDLRLTVARAFMITISPWIISRSFRQMSHPTYRFVWSDAWVVVMSFWMVLSVCLTDGAARGFVGAGVLALDFALPYLAARFLLQEHGQALVLCRAIGWLVVTVAMLSLLDTLTGRFEIRSLVASVTGYSENFRIDILERNGFLRASGTLEHPILLGTDCAASVLLAVAQAGLGRTILIIGAAVGLIASISSAPIGGCVLGLLLLAYRRMTPDYDGRWRLLLLVGGAAIIVFVFFYPNPFGFLISHLTFDPENGYYRLMTWQIAGEPVLESPIFGIGLSDDWPRPEWMPPTVDSIWLRSAMTFGIPGSAMIFLCMVGSTSGRVDVPTANLWPEERKLGLALSLTLALFIYLGATVHFWGATWILLGLLTGIRAHLSALAGTPRLSARQTGP